MAKKSKNVKKSSTLTSKLHYFILLFILLIVFVQVRDFDFVWDDQELYLNETNFPEKFSIADYLKFWNPLSEKMYIPITYTFWTLAADLSQKEASTRFNPSTYHTLNIIFHIINSFLVLIFLKKIINNEWSAFFGALLFGLHPLQSESVAWVSELRGVLAAFFALITFLLYIKYLKTKNEISKNKIRPNLYYYLAIITTLFSVLSKPSAIVLPLMLFIIDYFLFKGKFRLSLLKVLPFFLLVIPIMIRAKLAESNLPVDFGSPLWSRPFIFFDSLQFYLLKVILPIELVADYGRKPEFVLANTSYYLAWIIPLTIFVFLIIKIQKTKVYLASYFLFIAGFLALSGLVTFYFQDWSTVADRYLYLSMIGVSLAFSNILSMIKNDAIAKGIGIITIAIFSYLTHSQLSIWTNEFTLWDNNIRKYPDRSAHSYTGRGFQYLSKGDYQKALADFNKAIDLNPKYSRAYYNRGIVYYDNENYIKAIEDYSKAIELGLKHYDVFNNRGLAYSSVGKHNLAIEDYTTALNLNPYQPDTYVNRGISFAQLGNLEPAISDFEKALSLNPNDDNAKENLKYAIELLNLKNKGN